MNEHSYTDEEARVIIESGSVICFSFSVFGGEDILLLSQDIVFWRRLK